MDVSRHKGDKIPKGMYIVLHNKRQWYSLMDVSRLCPHKDDKIPKGMYIVLHNKRW